MTKTFKVLETLYDGHRFRSRLEARWAVFFKQLNIAYHYELEGYGLDGIGYLPDFYLPQQDCFIELKPIQPTTEELKKTRLLALYTGKDVYTFYGEIRSAQLSRLSYACRYRPPKLYTISQTDRPGESEKCESADAYEIAILLQKLDDIGLTLAVQDEFITLSTAHTFARESFKAQQYLSRFQQQHEQLAALAPQLQEAHDKLLETLTTQAGSAWEFVRQQLSWDFAWAECSACGELAPHNSREEDGAAALRHEYCPHSVQGSYRYTSPRLNTAYDRARQERFST